MFRNELINKLTNYPATVNSSVGKQVFPDRPRTHALHPMDLRAQPPRQVEVRALCTRLAVDQRGGRWQLWALARIESLPLAAHALINRLQQPIFPKINPDDQAFYDKIEAAARAWEEIHQGEML